MKNTPEAPPSVSSPPDRASRPALRNFYIAVVVLLAVFSLPLYELGRFALQSELFSYILLVPFISLYLVWQKRPALPAHSTPDRQLWVLPVTVGAVLLALRFVLDLKPVDELFFTTLSLVLFFLGLCLMFFGRQTLRAIAFPLGFLVFMAPFPAAVTGWLEATLQTWSASAASLFFTLGGVTYFRQETFFVLPNITLQIATECSGIHSTVGLFITSLLAGYFFLQSSWRRTVLVLVVFPIAILRNGFRVFVLGELCIRIGPHMIDTPIHHQGGPIFFVLSLGPFFLILHYLIKSERRATAAAKRKTSDM